MTGYNSSFLNLRALLIRWWHSNENNGGYPVMMGSLSEQIFAFAALIFSSRLFKTATNVSFRSTSVICSSGWIFEKAMISSVSNLVFCMAAWALLIFAFPASDKFLASLFMINSIELYKCFNVSL